MPIYKATLIQQIKNHPDRRGASHYMADGIFEYTIKAKNIDSALSKMLNHFYETYWFSDKNEHDMPISKFNKLSIDDKIFELQISHGMFDYIIYDNPDNNKPIVVSI
jgi:hypothetical protein